jgi:hypothetical protein
VRVIALPLLLGLLLLGLKVVLERAVVACPRQDSPRGTCEVIDGEQMEWVLIADRDALVRYGDLQLWVRVQDLR